MPAQSPRTTVRPPAARLVERRWRAGDRVRWGIYNATFLCAEGGDAVLLIGNREYRAPLATLQPAGART